MKIAILGATGPTGLQLVTQALERGYDVTALVRDPARLVVRDPHLGVVVGDATDPADLARALEGADAVVSSLGSGRNRSSDIASRAAAAMLPAAAGAGVARAIIMSAFGVGDTLATAGRAQRVITHALMKNLFTDKAEADDLIRTSALDWTLVYPVTLTNGSASGQISADERPRVTLRSRISRADVAAFMLDQIKDPTWLRRTVVIRAR